FKRDSEFLAARAVLEEPIPRADDVDPAVPDALADVIARSLARSQGDRYRDARAFAVAIEDAMAAHGGIASAPEIAPALAAGRAGSASCSARAKERRSSRPCAARCRTSWRHAPASFRMMRTSRMLKDRKRRRRARSRRHRAPSARHRDRTERVSNHRPRRECP